MATSARLDYSSFTLNAVTRTPITLAAQCSRVVLYNTDLSNGATLYAGDSGGTGKALPAGGQAEFSWPSPIGQASEVLVWGLADAGTPAITVEYHR